MSRMILDSLKNIRFKFRKEAQKTLDLDSCLKVLLHPNSRHLFLLFQGSKAAILLRDGQYDDKRTSLDLHCKRGTQLEM